jgi:hypothetical protein
MINKIINSEGQKYESETISELVFDAKPIVNSFNAITSDAVARAVAGASGEVPQVTESDNGKVLKAIYDEGGAAVEWGEATVDQTYDASSENAQSGTAVAEAVGTSTNLAAGKNITLSEFDGALHIGADDQLPFYSDADSGKVLQVQADGTLAWAVGSSKLTKLFGTVTNNEITGTAMPFLEPGYYQVNLMFDMTQYVSQFAFIRFGVDYGSQYSKEMSEELVPVDITSNGPFATGRLTHIRTGYLEISSTAEGLIADFVDWGGNAPSASLPITTATFYAVKIADLPY